MEAVVAVETGIVCLKTAVAPAVVQTVGQRAAVEQAAVGPF